MMQLTRGAFSVLEARHPHVSNFMTKQLFDPESTPMWVVVSADFKREVRCYGDESWPEQGRQEKWGEVEISRITTFIESVGGAY